MRNNHRFYFVYFPMFRTNMEKVGNARIRGALRGIINRFGKGSEENEVSNNIDNTVLFRVVSGSIAHYYGTHLC